MGWLLLWSTFALSGVVSCDGMGAVDVSPNRLGFSLCVCAHMCVCVCVSVCVSWRVCVCLCVSLVAVHKPVYTHVLTRTDYVIALVFVG
jgi:hypothetical protein